MNKNAIFNKLMELKSRIKSLASELNSHDFNLLYSYIDHELISENNMSVQELFFRHITLYYYIITKKIPENYLDYEQFLVSEDMHSFIPIMQECYDYMRRYFDIKSYITSMIADYDNQTTTKVSIDI